MRALSNMGVESKSFSFDLSRKHGENAYIFNDLIYRFYVQGLSYHENEEFCDFSDRYEVLVTGSDISNELFDIFNYIRVFSLNDKFGKFELFKNRQAEWGGPPVILNRDDVPPSNVERLPNFFIMYRGMSVNEYDSNNFSQSWTLSLDIARKFAFEIYTDEDRGLVASGIVCRDSIIHYSSDDEEQEVITGYGMIKVAKKLEV